MRTEEVRFYSEGAELFGVLRMPDAPVTQPLPAIVQGPGWLEVAGAPMSARFHEGLVAAGYLVLHFDYRGHGESEGERGWIRPEEQIVDIRNALTYMESRDDVDSHRLGLFGLGGTGGGNAIYVAARDSRPRCLVVLTVVADGRDWMRRMRREHEWIAFLERVGENSRQRVLKNEGELVDPTEDLMVATPERKAAGMPLRGKEFHLASAEHLLDYKPLDVVDQVSPRALLIVAVENDVVTPEDHALALYERAGPPKRLIRQTGVSHYEAYSKNHDLLMGEIVEWYDTYLTGGPVSIQTMLMDEEVRIVGAPR